jgi:peptidase E
MARQIVVSGGAGYWCGPDGLKLDEYVLSMTQQTRPKVCAVCTASGDSEEYIRGFHSQFGDRCVTSHLSLFNPPFEEPADVLTGQDVIYVGGGNTVSMLAVWRAHGIDRLLRDALDAGTILYGSSAGGICWFESGLTSSFTFDGSLRPLHEGLGFLAGSHAPHFDHAGRAEQYASYIRNGQLDHGIGIDDFAAVHFVDGQVERVVSSRSGATGHRLIRTGADAPTVTALPAMPL